MHTIGELCKKFNLSRSTILYYDKLGLLKPTTRQTNNYRIYNQEQILRLEKIISYKNSGLSLKDISNILDNYNSQTSSILLNRLSDIQTEIESLKKQQHLVIDVLKKEIISENKIKFTPKTWSEMLYELGYDENSSLNWHKEFEEENKDLHHQFLKSLGMNNDEINNLITLITK